MSADATITMTCLICDGQVRTTALDEALVFDKRHRETCGGAA